MPKVHDRIFNDAITEMLRQGLIYHTSVEEDRYSVVYASI